MKLNFNLGLKDLNAVGRNVLLSELGMDSMMAVEIKQTLEREFDTLLSAQDIRNLNFAKLIDMFDTQDKKHCSVRDTTDLTGIKLLVRVIGNEDLTTDVCLDLPTKCTSPKSEVFLLPGMEGCGSVFNPLVQKIETSASCLQHGTYNVGANCTSVDEIADCLLQVCIFYL
jgi:fatty acid synthase